MLEGIVADLLAKYLGDYVEGLDSENLKIGVMSGEVKLRNLQLKQSALDEIDLPIEVKSGFLGELHISVSWKALSSQPVVVKISDIFLLARPTTRNVNEEQEMRKKRERAWRQKRLQLAEVTGEDPLADPNKKDEASKEADTFTDRAVKKIVNNIQIQVDRIHIRFEDGVTSSSDTNWALGVTIQGFRAETTDGEWKSAFIADTKAQIIHKLVKLANLAVYHDCSCEFLPPLDASSDIRAISSRYIHQTAEDAASSGMLHKRRLGKAKSEDIEKELPAEHNFLLSPLSAALKVQLNSNDTDFSFPKVAADLILNAIDLNLSEPQWRAFDDFLGWTKNFRAASPYRDFRPILSAKQDPRAWWNFAFQCVVKENKKKRTVWDWSYLKKRKVLRKKYVALYKKKQRKTISPEGTKELTRLELDEETLTIDDILIFRSIANEILKREAKEERERKAREKKEKDEKGWSGWLFGGDSKSKNKKQPEPEVNKRSKADEEEEVAAHIWKGILDAVDDGEEGGGDSKQIVYPKDYVKIRGNFEIHNISLNLFEGKWLKEGKGPLGLPHLSPLLSGSLNTVKLSLLQREGSMSVGASIGSFAVKDSVSLPGMVVGMVEESHNISASKLSRFEDTFLSLDFHDHPLDMPEIDYALKLSSKPVDITLTRPIIKRLMSFFDTNKMTKEDQELLDYLNRIDNEKQKAAEMEKYKSRVDEIERTKGGAIFEAFNYAAQGQIEQARESAEAQFEAMKALMGQEKKPKLFVDVLVDAPNILIPQDTESLLVRMGGSSSSISISDSDCIFLELGSIAIKTTDEKKSKGKEAEKIDDFYDSFAISITGMQASLRDSSLCHVFKPNSQEVALTQAPKVSAGENMIVEKIDFLMNLDVAKLPLPHLPKIRIDSRFPLLGVVISNLKMKKLVEIAKGWVKMFAPEPQAQVSSSGSSSSSSAPALTTTAGNRNSSSASSAPSSAPSSSALSASSPDREVAEDKMVKITFTLEEARVTLMREFVAEGGRIDGAPLVVLSLQQTKIEAMLTSHHQTAKLSLGSFSIQDSLLSNSIPLDYHYVCSSDPSHQPVELGKKVVGKDLVNIEYLGTPSTSPKYLSAVAEHVITLQTSQMHINVNRPILASVMQMSKELVDSLALLQPPAHLAAPAAIEDEKGKGKEVEKVDVSAKEKLEKEKIKNQDYVKAISLSGSSAALSPRGDSSGSSADALVPLAKANLRLGSVSLSLNVEEYGAKKEIVSMNRFLLAELGSSAINAMVGKEGDLDVGGSVGTVKLLDLRSEAWSDIIHIKESEQLIDFKLVVSSIPSVELPKKDMALPGPRKRVTSVTAKHSSMRGKPARSTVGPVQNIEADFQMHSVEVVGKTELLPELLDYLKIFEELQKTAEADAKQVVEASTGLAQAETNTVPSLLLIKLNVKIDNCFVIAPLDTSDAKSGFARFDFGRITVSNTLYLQDKVVLFAIPMDEMAVHIGAMKLQTVFPELEGLASEKRSLREHVLWDTDIDILLVRPLVPLLGLHEMIPPSDRGSLPAPLAVCVSIPKIEVTLSDEQIVFLLTLAVSAVNKMQSKEPAKQENSVVEVTQEEAEKAVVLPGEALPSIELNLALNEFSISLSKLGGAKSRRDAELEGVLELSLTEMRQRFTLLDDGTMDLLLGIHTIGLIDQRKTDLCFKKILSYASKPSSRAPHRAASPVGPGASPYRATSPVPLSGSSSGSSAVVLPKGEGADMLALRFQKFTAVPWPEGKALKKGKEFLPKMEVDVSLNYPQITVVPKAAFDLLKFSLDLSSTSLEILSKMSQAPDAPASPPPTPEESLSYMHISCSLSKPHIVLPLDPTNPTTSCLGLETNMGLTLDMSPQCLENEANDFVMGTEIEMQIFELEMIKEGFAVEGEEESKWKDPILCPAKMSLSFSMIPGKEMLIALDGNELDFVLSYNDLKLILVIQKMWLEGLAEYNSIVSQGEAVSAAAEQAADKFSSSTDSPAPSPSSSSSSSSSPSPSPSVESITESASINIAFLGLTLIDDSPQAANLQGEVPLLRFFMQNLNLGASNFSNPDLLKADLNLPSLNTEFFNEAMEEWEPVLEKWECGIRLQPFDAKQLEVISDSEAFTSESSSSLAAFEATKSKEDKPEMGMDISIVSPEILNINFSKQMLSTLLRTARSWTEDAKKEELLGEEDEEKKLEVKKPEAAKNYSIRNLTGFNLYWTSHRDVRGKKRGVEDEEINVSVLPDNEEASLGEHFQQRTRRAIRSTAKDKSDAYVVSMELEFFLTHLVPPMTTSMSSSGNERRGGSEIQFDKNDQEGESGPVVLPIQNVSLQHAGQFVARLPQLDVICDIEMRPGACKVLTVRSSLSFKNMTSHSLAVWLTIPSANNPNSDVLTSIACVVPSGETYAIPFQFFMGGMMQIRPVSDENDDFQLNSNGSGSRNSSEKGESAYRWSRQIDIEESFAMIRDIKFAKARQKSQEFYDNSVISGCHPLQPALCRLKRKAEKLIESGPSDHDSDEIEENLLLSPKANKRDNKANMGLFWNGFIGWEEKALVTLPTDDPGAGSGRGPPRELVFSAQAPLVLENRLVCKFEFRMEFSVQGMEEEGGKGKERLSSHSKVSTIRGVVEKGKNFEVFSIPLVEVNKRAPKAKLFVKLKGYRWSDPIEVVMPTMDEKSNNKNHDSVVTMKDPQGGVLSLNLHNSNEGSKGCGRSLTFYCEYWIQNESQIPLLYSPTGNANNFAAGSQMVLKAAEQFSKSYKSETAGKRLRSSSKLFEAVEGASLEELTLNMLRRPFMYSNPKLKLKLGSGIPSKWTSSLELSGRYTSGVARLEGESKVEGEDVPVYEFGVEVTSAPTPFWRTKLVTIKPHILLVNLTSAPLVCSQSLGFSPLSSADKNPYPMLRLNSGEEKPFHWAFTPEKGKQQLLQVSLMPGANVELGDGVSTEGWDWSWSSGFPISGGVSRYEVKIRRHGQRSHHKGRGGGEKQKFLDFDEYYMVRATVNVNQSVIVVEFSHEKTRTVYEYLLENRTENDVIRVRQKGLPLLNDADHSQKVMLQKSDSLSDLAATERRDLFDYVIPPGYSVPFFQDDFRAEAKQQIEATIIRSGMKNPDLPPIKIHLDKLKKYKTVACREHSIHPMVIANGPTKRIIFNLTPDVPELEAKTDDDDEKAKKEKSEDEAKAIKFNLVLFGIGLSVIDEVPEELIYLSLNDLRFSYGMNRSETSVEVKIGRLQIDNQIFCTPYPIVLYPTLTPLEDGKGFEPFLHFCAVKSNLKEHRGVDYFRYMGFKMAKIETQVDEIFLLKTLSFVMEITNFLAEQGPKGTADEFIMARDAFLEKQLSFEYYSQTEREKRVGGEINDAMVYAEWFQINAMIIYISFLSTPWRERTEGADVNVVELMVHYLGSFSNLEKAPVKLNALILQRPFCPMSSLQSTITQHYIRQGLTEWYKIIGSAAVLGSPVTLIDHLGSGVYDFFHEPAQGFVAGPEAFGKGLAKGTTSLLKNTLSGVFGSASKFTDAVSGGLVKVGMDDEWERERRVKALKKPQHLGQGIQQGVVGLGEGVFYGVTGVVMQPVRGFQEEGGLGLVKGMGKGAAGLVLRPAVGVVDVFTRTAEGLQNMGNYLGDEDRRARIRPPRFIDQNEKLLKAFDWHEAARGAAARELKEGRFGGLRWNDSFSFFPDDCPVELKWNQPAYSQINGLWLYISNDKILLSKGSLDASRPTLELKWCHSHSDLIKVKTAPNGIQFIFKGKEKRPETIMMDKQMVERVAKALAKGREAKKGRRRKGSVLRRSMLFGNSVGSLEEEERKKGGVGKRLERDAEGLESILIDEEAPLLHRDKKKARKDRCCFCCDHQDACVIL